MTTVTEKKSTRVATFEIYNRITREVIDDCLTWDDAKQELAMFFDHRWENCWCLRQRELLKRGFPLAIRKAGNKGNIATKPMFKYWTEFERIEQEFLDAFYTAHPNRKERVEALRQKYDKKYS